MSTEAKEELQKYQSYDVSNPQQVNSYTVPFSHPHPVNPYIGVALKDQNISTDSDASMTET